MHALNNKRVIQIILEKKRFEEYNAHDKLFICII